MIFDYVKGGRGKGVNRDEAPFCSRRRGTSWNDV